MITDLSLVWTLTVLFALTGAYFVARCAVPRAVAAPTGALSRSTCLWHAVMAAGMVLMLWPAGMRLPRWPQLVVFGAGAAFFLLRAVLPGAGRARPGLVQHAVTMLAMLWMVLVMPASMATGSGTGSMADMPGMTMPGTAAAGHPAGPVVVSGVAIALLLAAFTVRSTARSVELTRAATAPAGRAAGAPRLSPPATEAAGHALMGLGMTVMTLALTV